MHCIFSCFDEPRCYFVPAPGSREAVLSRKQAFGPSIAILDKDYDAAPHVKTVQHHLTVLLHYGVVHYHCRDVPGNIVASRRKLMV